MFFFQDACESLTVNVHMVFVFAQAMPEVVNVLQDREAAPMDTEKELYPCFDGISANERKHCSLLK